MLPTAPITDSSLRIVFMGSPTWALPCMQALLAGPDQVVGAYCQPDKRAGRGRKITPPPVASGAREMGVPIYQPRTLRHPEVIEQLVELAPDVILVVAYGKILPPAVLEIPQYACINVHFSLLPAWRGAAPVQYAIIHGDRRTGVTTMLMDEGLDTGPILLQRAEDIRDDDSSEVLGLRLADLGADLLVETLDALRRGELTATPQDSAAASHARTLKKESGAIDWTRSSVEIERLVRGTRPWPGAYSIRDGKRLKIHGALLVDHPAGEYAPGEVVAANRSGITLACGDGFLSPTEVQPEGKRAMDAQSFVNGFRVRPGERWGS